MAHMILHTKVETLEDLLDLVDEVFGLAEDAYGGSPNDSGTPWTAVRYGLAHAADAREEFTPEELARPYDFSYFELEKAGGYDYGTEHPGYVHRVCHSDR